MQITLRGETVPAPSLFKQTFRRLGRGIAFESLKTTRRKKKISSRTHPAHLDRSKKMKNNPLRPQGSPPKQ